MAVFLYKKGEITMCGIIVAEKETKEIASQLDKILKRGPDDQRLISQNGRLFMFNRLAIMGLNESGMQPFTHNHNMLVSNAEIYNYKQIKQELKDTYTFKGDSDCEVLLPLYDIYGLDMFKMLDAEFAIVLHDSKIDGLIAGRDPIGIRPLFYGYDKKTKGILFSSEVKGIIDIAEKVSPFPPGHYYYNGQFVKYTDLLDIEAYSKDELPETLDSIRTKLEDGVIKRLDSDAPLGFLLSGGLDSSLVCSIASKHLNKTIRTFSIGMISDPIDLKYAKVVSDYLKTDHTEVFITQKDIIDNLDPLIYALETFDITTIRAGMGMYLLAKYIREHTDIKVLLTGEVSDELFGYKYTDFAPDCESFQKESVKRIHELHMYDVLRADRCLASNSLEARVPFGDISLMRYIMRINPKIKMNTYNMGKYLLRKAFEGTYLPDSILYRDKAAFSDAVGHSLVDYLKAYAEETYSDEDYKQKIETYHLVKPFTKESLLYMEIFQKHFPNHEHLVIDYWMPNKTWEGCNVDDPSARVLSNYGASGK